MFREGIRMLKVVFGCPKGASEYVEYKAWAAGGRVSGYQGRYSNAKNRIRMPKEGIRILREAIRIRKRASGYSATEFQE